jgi:hypothetical protein
MTISVGAKRGQPIYSPKIFLTSSGMGTSFLAFVVPGYFQALITMICGFVLTMSFISFSESLFKISSLESCIFVFLLLEI